MSRIIVVYVSTFKNLKIDMNRQICYILTSAHDYVHVNKFWIYVVNEETFVFLNLLCYN